MKQILSRLTYANVMSSTAVFLVLGGATAFAASKIGANQLKANSVVTGKIKKEAISGPKLKKNAVTGAKVKDGSLSGADINLATLGTVPSAAVANSLNGRIPVSVFVPSGLHSIATVGPFTILIDCRINNGGTDEAEFLLTTAVNGASMDDNNGDEFEVFNTSDNPAELFDESTTTGKPDIEVAEEPGLTAVAPDGTAILFQNETLGFNIAGHPGQCYGGGLIERIG